MEHNVSQATEWLFTLSCQLIAQISRPGEEASLPLVHFVGVLRIHAYNLVYQTAYAFTPRISGLLWICRFLMLEYSLPIARYEDICWPDRESYDDQTCPTPLCPTKVSLPRWLSPSSLLDRGISLRSPDCAQGRVPYQC